MHWKSIMLFVLTAFVVAGSGFSIARDKTAQDPKHKGEQLAIDQFTRDFEQTWLRIIHSPSA